MAESEQSGESGACCRAEISFWLGTGGRKKKNTVAGKQPGATGQPEARPQLDITLPGAIRSFLVYHPTFRLFLCNHPVHCRRRSATTPSPRALGLSSCLFLSLASVVVFTFSLPRGESSPYSIYMHLSTYF